MSATIAQRAADATSDRLVAYLIDFALLSGAAFVLWIIAAVVSSVLSFGAGMGMDAADPAAVTSGSLLATMAVNVVVYGVLWLAIGAILVWYFVYYADDGQTFGKRSQDVAVVSDDGAAPSKRQRWIRAGILLAPFPLMALLGAVLQGLGFVFAAFIMAVWLVIEAAVMFLSDDGQRIGDRAANTYVVGTDG
ncbi:RDD family protein [Halomicrobium zhouii]|uniref:RDD family protein n=1 Tax=Halomicrobium zhouii TaxID=767519 RepID=A0A1I6KB81_9EURY|nr:RDD family protein [Halomicrobium zhouii]SFR88479.1 RDD family protein [Halomicrobium zhouii]